MDFYNARALEHALECALWSSSTFEGEALDENYSICDIADTGVLEPNLYAFIKEHKDTLEALNITAEQCGYDYWLTSCGHGAGFWDRGHGAPGQVLSDACCDSYDAYVGDDNKVYIS